jgi:nucleoside-diphosphate-sugar epimerase
MKLNAVNHEQKKEMIMKVFMTGATGFVGSAVVQELIKAGHQVTGLARSEANAKALAAAGAAVQRGDLEDLESLRQGAAAADGVIHTGFIHDWSRFKEVCEVDRRAIEALGSALAGSDRPLIVTSGTALLAPGRQATEEDMRPPGMNFPRVSEEMAMAAVGRGVRAMVVRLAPSVHGDGDHGFVPNLIKLAREKGVSAYIGDGRNRWTAVHRLDAARLYRLALEQGVAGGRYHGVAEEEVVFRDLATAIGKGLNVPVVSKSLEEAEGHFGWFARFAGLDSPASSRLTQERLGWRPVEKTLLADLERGTYFKV